MRLAPRNSDCRAAQGSGGFNLVEAMIAMAVCAIMFIALYSGINSSFFKIRLSRENLRATQILIERMEVIRLCTWEQVNSNGFIPVNFTAPLYPELTATNAEAMFQGTIKIEPVTAPAGSPPAIPGGQLAASYRDDLKLVTVTINWKTGNLQRTRTLSSYISRFGIQNYVYAN
ncbi:MAG: hypothetical protein L0Y58_16880 [Verrucomicrobia subdivision 3 bacterium]|nr:hypothetical protein [Limisphaerales bacterium]